MVLYYEYERSMYLSCMHVRYELVHPTQKLLNFVKIFSATAALQCGINIPCVYFLAAGNFPL